MLGADSRGCPESFVIATDFWCDKLRHPEFTAESEWFDEMTDSWDCGCCRVQEEYAFSEEDESSFKLALIDKLERELSKQDEVELYADFYPMGILDEICKDIGLNEGFIFPSDTTMLVTKDEVIVKQSSTGREILWSR